MKKQYWLIPKAIYEPLNAEFSFDFDPCPYPWAGVDGCSIEWGSSNWVNPPFARVDAQNGHGPTAFVRKAIEQQKQGKTSVLILPVPAAIHALIEAGAEARPAGRVKWREVEDGSEMPRPNFCAVFILRGKGPERHICNYEACRPDNCPNFSKDPISPNNGATAEEGNHDH